MVIAIVWKERYGVVIRRCCPIGSLQAGEATQIRGSIVDWALKTKLSLCNYEQLRKNSGSLTSS